MEKIFGIDLGTTYSCIAYVDEYGKATVINNNENKPVTPSVVYFESEENVPVGDVAKEKLETDPHLVCSTVKRQMGNRDWFFEAHGKQFSAETISSLILQKLTKDASIEIGENVKDVVITCPAYFGMAEKEATKTAGRIAGLNVLGVLNEPTAAALSYGLDSDKPETVLIYDLGGGTFDVTIIQVDPGKLINVVATGGDHNLGGKDWDERIRGYIIEQFTSLTGVSEDDIYDDPEAIGDLELKAEKAKKDLSQMSKTTVRFAFGGNSEKIEITKEQFDSMTDSLLNNTIELTNQMLEESKIKGVNSYDKILLVGGSTKMPQIRERLLAEYPNVPIEVFDPDTSVAKGAAIYGMNIAGYNINNVNDNKNLPEPIDDNSSNGGYTVGGGSVSSPITIRNVLSQSFGVLLTCSDDKERVVNILPKQINVPTERTLRAGTLVANQTSVLIAAYENSFPGENTEVEIDMAKHLVEGTIAPLPEGLPAGSPIDITFIIGEDGLLKIKALDVTGNNEINIEVDVKNAMTEEEIQEAIKTVSGITVI